MADAKVIEEHQLPEETPVYLLNCAAAWNALSDQEKLYAHYLSQASWAGTKICMRQLSVESIPIFEMFNALFHADGGASALKGKALAAGVAESDYTGFLQYVLNFYGNMGNYKSFGDTKFIPRIPASSFEKIVRSGNCDAANKLFDQWGSMIYSLKPAERELGFPDSGHGLSCYYSPNVTRQEIDLVTNVMTEHKIGFYNTRLFKLDDGTLEVRQASSETGLVAEYTVDGRTVRIVRGDHADEMKQVVANLEQAEKHALNETERGMLKAYIKAFQSGNEEDHKESQRWWVKDKGPVVETNIGFIESYRDPLGMRGEWEGFVAVVNKEMTAKFSQLVARAEAFIAQLPWPREYEKEKFLQPDFTSLEVISFASSGIPAGINIPNYDDIRQSFGFKNVSLGNVLAASKLTENVTFLRDEDQEIYKRLLAPAFEVQVGIHELLGHGSGKLFMEVGADETNFDRAVLNPLTNKPVDSWYKPGQTYDAVFGSLSSAMEECRAESCGIYLCLNRDILNIFGHSGKDADDVIYVNWLNMCRAGLLGLEFYSPEAGRWRQAHMQARYSILSVLLEAGNDLVRLVELDGDIHVVMDRSKIESVGIPAIANFLQQMQVAKATADVQSAIALFGRVSAVSERMLKYREIVLAKKKPRRLFVQCATRLSDAGQVELVEFDASAEGMVTSYLARFAK